MRKIFALAMLLALVAIMAVPMTASAATTATGSTTVGGSIAAPSVTVAPPGAIAFGILMGSTTAPNNRTATPGSVSVVMGTSGTATWTVTASQVSGINTLGFLAKDATPTTGKLNNPLFVSDVSAPATWATLAAITSPVSPLNGDAFQSTTRLSWTGSTLTGSLPFYVRQWVDTAEATKTGTYSITITFTAVLS